MRTLTVALALALASLVPAGAATPGAAAPPAAAAAPKPSPPPTAAEVRKAMGIASTNEMRGQQDAVGFASTAEQMAKTWELSATPPQPERLGPRLGGGVVGVIAPHDDYLYAGRVYREIVPLVTAKTVVLVGVFHKYRKFGIRDRLVFDTYRTWRTPDGPVPVSALRDELLARLPKEDFVQDAAAHDAEHSLEAVLYWLKHIRPDLEIVPIIVPAATEQRLAQLADRLGKSLADLARQRGWTWGKDIAVAISSDAVHYGPDFEYTPYGDGGIGAYAQAVKQDRRLITIDLAGPLDDDKVTKVYDTFVEPENVDQYRVTWCGRFAVPFGLLLLDRTLVAAGLGRPVGHPVAYATSVGWPELPLRTTGMGATAPDSLYHFVGYPAVAYTYPGQVISIDVPINPKGLQHVGPGSAGPH